MEVLAQRLPLSGARPGRPGGGARLERPLEEARGLEQPLEGARPGAAPGRRSLGRPLGEHDLGPGAGGLLQAMHL